MDDEARARAWYAQEMSEQPADCACYEGHIAALVTLLAEARREGAEGMRARAVEVAKERAEQEERAADAESSVDARLFRRGAVSGLLLAAVHIDALPALPRGEGEGEG